MHNKSILNEQDYYRKVYGGWLGKNIGGTLGAEDEGKTWLLNNTFYPSLPDKPLANDDLDMQLVWLHALEQYGARITAKELGQEWVEHVFFPFDEYGYTLTNLRQGLQAPVCGWYNNPFTNCMGSPIRSEIWAMIAPGAPGVAAYYAYQDAIVDHAGGEGVYGEIFLAALESAAFLESNRDRLIEIGLSFIPEQCRIATVVKDVLASHAAGDTWLEARAAVIEKYGHFNFTEAPQNIGFMMIGWLYGEDFGDCLLKAANCGYDTDCTAATLGAILGLIGGAESIPEQWIKPIGSSVVASPQIKGFAIPKDLDELTRRTMQICREVITIWNIPVTLAAEEKTSIAYENLRVPGHWAGDYDPRPLLEQNVKANHYLLPEGSVGRHGLEVIIHYGEEGPAVPLKGSKELEITLINHSQEPWEGELELEVPPSWSRPDSRNYQLQPEARLEWKVTLETGDRRAPFYELSLHIRRWHDDAIWNDNPVRFVLLAASYWKLWGPGSTEPVEAAIAGNLLAFGTLLGTEERGSYRAASKLINPCTRNLRVIIGTPMPVKVHLNGRLVLEDGEIRDFVAGYHRSYMHRLFEVELAEGEHWLEIEAAKLGDDPLEIYVLPVAFTKTKTPGGNYYHTDILFG